MKILNVGSIRQADVYTIENEPILSIDLMERAAEACHQFIIKNFTKINTISVFVGTGNNGGDGLALARFLSSVYSKVTVYTVEMGTEYSPEFQTNLKRLEQISKIKSIHINSKNDLPENMSADLVIDAIFGIGLNRAVTGIVAEIINYINNTQSFVIAIDIPSGLLADEPTDFSKTDIVRANLTLSLEFPKFTMLLPESNEFVGLLQILPIGIHHNFITTVKPTAILLEDTIVAGLISERPKFSHKGNFGHALLISGSKNKSGAAVLASKACMRSGAGLLTTHAPEIVANVIRNSLPEAMLSLDSDPEYFSVLPDLSSYNAIGIGPGIGTNEVSVNAVKLLIQNYKQAIVMDADALNILGENKTWLGFLTPGTILTPHPREFERIAGKSYHSYERIQKQIEMSKRFGIFIILKGAHSTLSCPDGSLYFNNTGNPGMATAGTGDVLTGIILGLLSQGYSAHNSAVLGMYIHGLAGDLALENESIESLIASDIIDNIGSAFNYLRHGDYEQNITK